MKYMEITKVVKEEIWLRGLFSELVSEKGATIVYCYSQSFIHLTKYQMHHEKTKHIDIFFTLFERWSFKMMFKFIKLAHNTIRSTSWQRVFQFQSSSIAWNWWVSDEDSIRLVIGLGKGVKLNTSQCGDLWNYALHFWTKQCMTMQRETTLPLNEQSTSQHKESFRPDDVNATSRCDDVFLKFLSFILLVKLCFSIPLKLLLT